MSRLSLTAFGVLFVAGSASSAWAQQPVQYRGMNIQTTVKGGNQRSSTVFIRLFNPNPKPVDARNIRCEFHQGDQLVKRISIARIAVQPGEQEYEAPEKVEAPFNRPVCTLSK